MRRLLRHLVSFCFEIVVAAAAFLGAYVTAYGYPTFYLVVPGLADKVLGFAAASAVAFLVTKPYRGSWRYVSIPDLVTILKASALAVTIYTIGAFLLTRGENVPRSVVPLTLLYMIVGLAGARLCYRIVRERMALPLPTLLGGNRAGRHVLLCGLSDKAESFIRSNRRDGAISIAGILDESQINLGRTVQGVPVLGNLDNLGKVLEKLERQGIEVGELIVTEIAPGRRRLATIVECVNAYSLKVSRIPDITEMATVTSEALMEPRPIELGDLLERPEVKADVDGVARLIRGQAVLVTGAGGSIGSELSRQIAELQPSRLVITDSSEFLLYRLDTELRDSNPGVEIVTRILDVRDSRRVASLMATEKPQLVFHAAALKHVPLMEANPLEAIKTNVLGTRNVADAALANRVATFVMISTDKAVNPTNVMGATKRAAEAYCQALDVHSTHTRFKTIRFGNVLGSNGSVVPRFQQQIAAGGPVTVTHPEIVRYFMTIPEAVTLVLHACSHALARRTARGHIMVLDMGKPVRIVDLAERMIQLAGYRPRIDIDIVFTGLRPGEKLFEELFAPSEALDGRTEEGYVIAAPRVIDRLLLDRTMTEIVLCVDREDTKRVMELLSHIVPEYRRGEAETLPPANLGV